MALQYLLVIALVISGYFTPVMLVVLVGLYHLPGIWKLLNRPTTS